MRIKFMLAVLVAAFGAVTSAQAGLVGSKAITVRKIPGGTNEIAEFQAFETGTGINVAEQSNGGVASDDGANAFGTVPGDANDGNTNGSFGGGSVWHSNNNSDVLRIDLAAATQLDTITIFGRTDGCCTGRNANLEVRVLDEFDNILFEALGVDASNAPATLELPNTGVPEPATAGLLALTGLAFAGRRRRRSA